MRLTRKILKILGVTDYISLWHKFFFIKAHWSDVIKFPLIISPRCIKLGRNVHIGFNARIEGISQYNNMKYKPLITICDNVSIEQNLHLTCANRILIGRNTAIAANVTITDIHHPYTDISVSVERQDLDVKETIIGEDCKIYNNVVILPGVHIGKHVTIGANSVVTTDISDFSVAVGTPARIVKRYDFNTSTWVKVE